MEHFKNILFVDIETVPLVPEFEGLTTGLQAEWVKKSRLLKSASIENAAECDHTFSMLMGDEVAPRRDFIEKNAKYARIDT